MSESVRLKEIRVRQEIYKEFLKQIDVSPNGVDSNGAEGVGRDETAPEARGGST
jgi:hypothetical protein